LRARKLAVLTLLFLPSRFANAAYYDPKYFFAYALGSYENVSLSALNRTVSTDVALNSVLSWRLGAERGLIAPAFTHWIEVGGFTGSLRGQAESGSGIADYQHNLNYISLIPFGATWWFKRSAFVDIGLGAGVGFALSPTHTLTGTLASNGTSVANFSSTAPLGVTMEARFAGRLWLHKYWAMQMQAAFRLHNTTFRSATDSVPISLNAFSITLGATYAFGGVKGVGRTFVEVLPANPAPVASPKPVASPGPKPAPTPQKAILPKTGKASPFQRR